MLFKLKRYNTDFNRNVLTMTIGTGLAQVIPIVISPILTRIYTPANFGLLSLYLSISSILSLVATGRYEMAIILPKKDIEGANIMVLSMIINFFLSLLILLLITIFNTQITGLFKNDEISKYLYLVSLTVFLTGIYQSLIYWNNRKKNYKSMSITKIIQSGGCGFFSIGLGLYNFGGNGLILSSIFGQVIAISFFGRWSWNKFKDIYKSITRINMVALAKKYINFPQFNLFHAVINVFSSQMPIFILAYFFSNTVLGFYSFSLRIVQIPIGLISVSIYNVLSEKIVTMSNNCVKYMPYVYKFLLHQFIIGVILIVSIYFGSHYFSYVFGIKWAQAELYVTLLLPWMFMVFLVSPLTFAVNMTFNQKKGLILEIFYGLLKLSTLLYGCFQKDIVFTLKLFSTSNALYLFFNALWILSILKKFENKR